MALVASSVGRFVRALGVAVALVVAAVAAGVGGLGPAFADGVVVAADRLQLVTASGPVGFTVEIADTDASRAQGLMWRRDMAPDHGMLFDFRREEPVWFWMKNTPLSLDMIFVKADGRVLSIARGTVPFSEATVPSGGPVRFVFEVVAGTADRIGLKPGDRMIHARVAPAK